MNKVSLSLTLAKKQVDNLATDKTIKFGLKVLFIGLGLGCLWLALWWVKLPPELPLFYSRPYGESRLTNQWNLWLLPAVSLMINLVSIKSAANLLEKDKLLAQIIVWTATITTTMILVSLIKVVLLVI